ncbi:conserved hypothetical protein (plasmid) [Deferribacter desulfuricans SSM1]|uniref:Competence protein ComFB n=1 Tax=Deferribacter desulfuricans (strain DSM 14783 / JCM 11476 / NBRC 101012 / SSM1) TaxID=639282 RepID=D3PEJ3_DEFDS|nr:late competence development ComFB family protein [Deferribacter desulfuricans]BAI81635.1 conserved hypothetical protein [Deferribacter desulfuricans SSM1]
MLNTNISHNYFVNLNEQRVVALVKRYLSANPQYCSCAGCVTDVIVMTLNQIPPHYIVKDSAAEYAYQKISDSEIIRHIVNNIEIVKKEPKNCLRK